MTWRLQRLNLDCSWWVDIDGDRVVFDPWLVGSEVDYAPWFHEAWHQGPVMRPDEVPEHEVICVSQPFSDHCHPPTLSQMPGNAVIAVVPSARDAVAAACPGRQVLTLPELGGPPLQVHGLRLWRVTPKSWMPPVYHAVVVADRKHRAVVHAPHGMPRDLAEWVGRRVRVWLAATSRMHFRLPRMLGGDVNPGPEAADAAVRAMAAMHALEIHDEDKKETGLIARVARIRRVPLSEADPAASWLEVPDLEPVTLGVS